MKSGGGDPVKLRVPASKCNQPGSGLRLSSSALIETALLRSSPNKPWLAKKALLASNTFILGSSGAFGSTRNSSVKAPVDEAIRPSGRVTGLGVNTISTRALGAFAAGAKSVRLKVIDVGSKSSQSGNGWLPARCAVNCPAGAFNNATWLFKVTPATSVDG